MNFNTLMFRNILRNRFRSITTSAAVGIAILTFVLLRTLISAWTNGSEQAAQDRVATRHKVSFVMSLPKRYVEEIAEVPGVRDVASATWFGGRDPNHPHDFFATLAVEPQQILKVYDEMVIEPAQREEFISNRKGALVGKNLAKRMGWKVGDKITLKGTIFPGHWPLEIVATYDSTRRSIDLGTLFFHYDYVNESLGPRRKDRVGWVIAKVNSAEQAAQVASTIDTKFDERDIQTLSMSERAMNTSFLGMLSAALGALDVVCAAILLIMTLILGNTTAMGVRERVREYGILRALGFHPKHLARLILGEALFIGLVGGTLGLALAFPVVQNGVGLFLEENMGGVFPYVRIQPVTAVLALTLAAVLGVIAALIPATRIWQLNIVRAIRRVG